MGPKRSGIYAIINTVDGKRYIGSSVDIERRFRHHRKDLVCDRHWNTYLQRAFNRYGEAAFLFEVLEEEIPVADLLTAEQRWVDSARSWERDYGYNLNALCKRGLSSPEGRARQAERQRGVKRPAHVIEALRAANLGRKRSAESRAKQSASTVGRKHSEETCRRKSVALKGKKRTPAQVEALRILWQSPALRANLRRKRRQVPDDVRARIRSRVMAGEFKRALAREFGIDKATVSRIAKELI